MAADIDALVQGHDGQGVIAGCAVSPQVPEALGVTVASGTIRLGGAAVAVAGGNVSLSTADPDAPRVDLIVAAAAGALTAIAGTPAPIGAESGPAAPALPSDRVLLAMVLVEALDITIPAAQIIDKRVPVLHPTAPRSLAANATARVGDRVLLCTAALTLTLYPASDHLGGPIVVINDSIGNVTIDGNGAETINGQTTVTVPAGGIVQLFPGTGKWFAW